ncbi:C40 family peptidase [Sporanaerobacter acetigenes]|uniref:NlpC/P60 family protein n=1 Tax=Sporanaerobacter acetigenes DSM 13106 TaxID=1123281 RepID=A0A1M5UN19_9FIRM|nr:C40 family peptidase [Sporanaerobacter acetigenes]SHH64432.1 NlpC/P60 family protein [Sporanaerobacter acetigenes DSM 13106]
MGKKRRSFIATILILVMFSSIGFADTGIFIKNFSLSDKNGIKENFSQEEVVDIEEESKGLYTIKKDSNFYEVPKEYILKTKKINKNYKAIDKTNLLDKPNSDGRVIGELKSGEIVTLISSSGEYGLFAGKNFNKGYAKMKFFKDESFKEDYISCGISTVNKTINNGGKCFYILVKGDIVPIKEFRNNKFIVIDEFENEFQVPKDYIKLDRGREFASRNMFSRRTSSLNKLISSAHAVVGSPYVSGDIGEKGYDCSGLTFSIYKNSLGIKLPRSSRDQVGVGVPVKKSELLPGDLVFFNTSGKGISHVGLYIGDQQMIHASSGSKKVERANINSKYYASRYVTARRIVTNK